LLANGIGALKPCFGKFRRGGMSGICDDRALQAFRMIDKHPNGDHAAH
jgi:hypothetical protein